MLSKRFSGKLLFVFSFLLFSFYSVAQSRSSFDGVRGDLWLDTDGNHIQAHGGQVQKIGDKWWWIGENRDDDRSICLYSSDDLYNWKNEGKVLRVASKRSDLDEDPYFIALYGHLTLEEKDLVFEGIQSTAVLERPKLIYNEKTGKYIIWYHADSSNYGAAAAGIAVSDEITGPYTYLWRSRLHQLPDNEYSQPNQWYEEPGNRGMARDMNLFVDDDKTAYIIYSSEENRTMFISRLNEEYTDLDVSQTPVGLAKNGVDFIRLFPGAQREAPAMFKYAGKYYMITSGATGWDPNRCQYWMADKIFGEWENMGDPCVNEPGIPYPANLTFRTQSTNVIPVDPENGKFIYMGDRWVKGNLKDSRYVWLPIFITPTGLIELRSMEDWDLSYFEKINNVRVDPSQFNSLYFADAQLPSSVSAQMRTNGSWTVENISLEWESDIRSLLPLSTTWLNGSFDINGTKETIKVQAVNIPKGLLYFIDSGALEGSDLYKVIQENKQALTPMLVNTDSYDQAFTDGNEWGYVGIIGEDIDYKNETSSDAFQSGWWAYGNKTIDYKLRIPGNGKYRLTMGFQEWWDTGRGMSVNLIYQNTQGEKVSEELGRFINSDTSTQDYVFTLEDLDENKPYITVSVAKTGGADVVMSWLALVSMDLSGLDIAIEAASAINNDEGQYTPERFNALIEALEEAMQVRDNSLSSDKERGEAEDKLTLAMMNLEVPDTTALETLIETAEGLPDDERYTAVSFDNLQVVLEQSKELITDSNVSQPEIDKAANLLSNAISGLKFNFENSNYVEIASVADQEYTGNAILPKLEIIDNANSSLVNGVLEEGKQYSVKYVNNIEVGEATAIITGKGMYEGMRTISFNIVPVLGLEQYWQNGLDIYPNPVGTKECLYIGLAENEVPGADEVNIYTLSGQLVQTQKLIGRIMEMKIDVAAGMYIISVGQQRSVLIVK